jgi:hypothetical protein
MSRAEFRRTAITIGLILVAATLSAAVISYWFIH